MRGRNELKIKNLKFKIKELLPPAWLLSVIEILPPAPCLVVERSRNTASSFPIPLRLH